MRFSRTLRTLLLSLAAALLAPSTSAQTFAQPTVIPTGNWPRQVLTGDFDGDGNPDLLYLQFVPGIPAGQNDTLVKIAFGDGAGNFSAPVQQGTLNSAVSLVVNVADVNGDGITDMFYAQGAASGPSTLGVWFGDRSRTLQTPSAYTQRWLTGNSLSQIVGFSLNTYISGDPTLIALDSTRTATVFTYTLGLLRPVLSFALPDGAGPAVATDVNGDGIPDLVVLGQPTGTIDVFLTSSRLDPYSPPLRFPVTGIHSFFIRDVNFDGVPDLIAEGAGGRIDVYPGNGDGTFQTQSLGGTGTLDGTTGNGGHLIAVADLNHDGLPDALAITPAGVSVLLGNGTAYLGLNGIYNAGPTGANGHPSYVTADFNHDGTLDLAVDSPEGIAILFGNPDGTFQTSRAFAADKPAMSSVLGAFTASGHADAAVSISSTTAQLLFGQGDGTFIAAPTPVLTQTANPPLWGIISAADLNSDGNLDLVVTADGPAAALPALGYGITVGFGQGDGTFTIPSLLNTHANPGGITFFGTGTAGPALGPSGGPGIVVLDQQHLWDIYNLPAPTGLSSTAIATLSDPHAHNLLVAGDFHSSTLPDLIAQDEGSLKLYPHSASGFAAPSGDLSIDGSLTTPAQLTAPALSPAFNGPAIPTSSGGLGFPAFLGAVAVADLDRDGNQDLLVTYANLSADRAAPTASAPNYLYIWYGSGGGKFLTSTAHPVNPVRLTLSRNYYQVAVADLNRDGIPDLILSDGYLLSVQLGLGNGTFGPETHYLAGQGINTISAGDLNADGAPDLVLANGGAVLTNPVANLEALAANPDVNTGGITVLLNHAQAPPPPAPTSLSLRLCVDDPGSLFPCGNPLDSTPLVSPVTMFYGQVLDGVAIESATNLTGTITFLDGTRVFCTINANLTGTGPMGNACPTNAGNFHAGTRSVDATYSGDSANAASTSNSIAVQVFPDITTSAIASSLNPATVGQAVTFTATLTGNFATPTGSVTFFDGLTQIGTGTLDLGGHASFTTSTLAAGSHPIAVAYSGTPDFNPAPTTLLTQVINPAIPVLSPTTTFLVAIGPTTILFNQPANSHYYTTVADLIGHPPTGTVTVQDNGVSISLCTAIHYGSTCPYAAGGTNRLSVGTHSLVVLYNGDSFNAPSASAPLVFNVLPGTTTITLGSSLNPAPLGVPVTFTATLSGTPILPAGSVTFLDGTTLLATVPIDPNGNATFTTSALAVGIHPITVAYPGNANFGPAASAILSQVITAPAATPPPGSFTLTVTPSPITIAVGRTGLLLVTITANGSFAQPVALTCSTITPETACDFILPTIPTGGGSTTLELHTSAPHDCGDPEHPYFLGSCTPPPAGPSTRPRHPNLLTPRAAAVLFPSLLLFGAGFLPARRRLRSGLNGRALTLLLVILSFASLATLSGCGTCTDLGTPSGRYTFTITATAQGGPVAETQSQTIPLTITIP